MIKRFRKYMKKEYVISNKELLHNLKIMVRDLNRHLSNTSLNLNIPIERLCDCGIDLKVAQDIISKIERENK